MTMMRIAICMVLMLQLWGNAVAQADYAALITYASGEKSVLSLSGIQSVEFLSSEKISQDMANTNISYKWQYGGIRASNGEIYSRRDRIYSNLIKVHKGDVIKTQDYLYTMQFYGNDSLWISSDYEENGFRNRDYLVTQNGLIRLLVAKPDFGDFSAKECRVWIQRGGYEPNAVVAKKYPQLFPRAAFGLQAHRGICNEIPENTMPSFEAAARVELYKGIETDVQMTSDGVLVCMHDNTIDRTTNGTGKVSDYTFEQLQEFYIDGGYGWDASYAGRLRVPTFESYLDVCRKYNKVPYVELKLLTFAGIRKTIEMLRKKGFEDGSYVLTSFTKNYLLYASTICDAPLEFMATFTEADIAKNAHLKNIILRPQSTRLTEGFVKKCHEADVLVECYGIPVGDETLVKSLQIWGVEGGTCNSWKGLGLE